jgi:hypothetical protein
VGFRVEESDEVVTHEEGEEVVEEPKLTMVRDPVVVVICVDFVDFVLLVLGFLIILIFL